MSLGLYMDVHVPLPITRGLRRRGVAILTAQEDHTTRASDPELLRRALELGRVVFSQDEDMIAEAVRCQRGREAFSTIVFARQLDLSIGRCIGDLERWPKPLSRRTPRDRSFSSEARRRSAEAGMAKSKYELDDQRQRSRRPQSSASMMVLVAQPGPG